MGKMHVEHRTIPGGVDAGKGKQSVRRREKKKGRKPARTTWVCIPRRKPRKESEKKQKKK